jgi:hypothetical protein
MARCNECCQENGSHAAGCFTGGYRPETRPSAATVDKVLQRARGKIETFDALREEIKVRIAACENSISAQEGRPERVFPEVEKRTWEYLARIIATAR